MIGDSQPGDADHVKIVGTVAQGNGLLQADVFYRGDGFENFSLFGSVDDISRDVAGDFESVRDR